MLATAAILAGCVATPQGVRIVDVRDPTHFQGERVIPLTFPKIQAALFKHQAACGAAATFTLDPMQTSYATITDMPAGATSYENAIVVDLTQYRAGYLADERVKAQVYSYYSDSATKTRIDQLFKSITNPQDCPETGK